ncbi:MAG: hypothetical protein ABL876_08735 [Chitinophagaceae bacterium]
MRYFDFHTHILFKQIFDENPNIDTRISSNDVTALPKLCSDLPNIIQSQIHQSQLADFGEEVIAGVVLYGMESYLAEEVIPLRKFLKSGSKHKLSEKLLKDIAANKYKAFSQFTLERTLNEYIKASSSFNILDGADFAEPLPKNKVNVFFVVEGCHSLVDTHNKYLPPNEFFPVDEILANLDILLTKVKVLSVNPTHLQQSNLCNHAFAMQLAKIDPFIPTGNGLEDDGRKVIQGLFNRGVCVDLKHMSYKSRFDLMNDVDGGKFQNIQPVLCTHTGFTGISFSEWPGYINLKKPMPGTSHLYLEIAKTKQVRNNPPQKGAPAFNMSTINLFDEEIAWIVSTGGVIGLSLDRRILGYVGPFDDQPAGIKPGAELIVDKEFFSKKEWKSLSIPDSEIGKLIKEGDCVTIDEMEEINGGDLPARNKYFMDHVLLHLKHYFQACVNAGIPVEVAQKHITVGSDFDGLINPFLNMEIVNAVGDLKKFIKKKFSLFLTSLKDSKKWAHELDVDVFAEDFFYNNGYEFVKSRM